MLARCKRGSISQVRGYCQWRCRYFWRRLYGFGSRIDHMSAPLPHVPDKQGGRRMREGRRRRGGEGEKRGERMRGRNEMKEGDEGRR